MATTFNLTSDASIGQYGISLTSDAEIGTGSSGTTFALPYSSNAYIVAVAPAGPGPLPKTGCEFSTPCEDPSIPVGNYSSETPEVQSFSGVSFPIVNPNDPINGVKSFQAQGCISVCESAISQTEANLCAARQAFECANTPPPGYPPSGTYFFSRAAFWTIECPDGNPFTYNVPAGAFVGLSQSAADAQAVAYARLLASKNAICLGTVPNGCVGSAYSANVHRSAGGVPPFRYSIVAGILPPGIDFAQTDELTGLFSGTPILAGSFTFTLRAVDAASNWMDKEITVCILGNTASDPPSGQTGTAYNYQLTAPSCAATPLSWQVGSGSLPPGLTLDESTGVISGTPTEQGTFNFTIRLQTNAT